MKKSRCPDWNAWAWQNDEFLAERRIALTMFCRAHDGMYVYVIYIIFFLKQAHLFYSSLKIYFGNLHKISIFLFNCFEY